ncbi:MAG: putative zinc-binding protein [Candidatus Promineifilaceae bacterium]
MPKLPQKKVGIVACSGEELAEGTVTRLAALRVLEDLRPNDTVTICLPLFLAGGEGDRAFARFYPTIAVDGCELRCAARATEMYSGKPAASIVVTDVVNEAGLDQPEGLRRLNEAGLKAVETTAHHMAFMVDDLLGKRWSRRRGDFLEDENPAEGGDSSKTATCACGSGIPIQTVTIGGDEVTLIALPALFEQFQEAGKQPTAETDSALLEQVKIYNLVPDELEAAYLKMLQQEYAVFCAEKEPVI